MRKLDAIRRRMERATDPNTNTDEKMENGALSDFVIHGENDVAWLLQRVNELTLNGRKILQWLDRSGRTPYIDGIVGFRAAIRTIDQESEEA